MVKLTTPWRKKSKSRMPDLKTLSAFKLPDVKIPEMKMPDEIRLPDVTLPRVAMGKIKRNDLQLPDVTLPRLKMGDVAYRDMRLHGPKLGGPRAFIRLAVMSLFGMAIYKEMSQPEAERTWHGDVFGVPYDFRPPTAQRLRDAWWNEYAGLFTTMPWGVGWTINFRKAMDMAMHMKDTRLHGMAGAPKED